MISAKIICDSLSPQGKRLTTMQITFPRIILAETNTHRLFSRNSASSRAIPFSKMLKSVINNPFIPIAVQTHHSGMQGTEYLDMDREYTFEEIRETLQEFLTKNFKNDDGTWDEDYLDIDEVLNTYVLPLLNNGEIITWRKWWLKTRDLVIAAAMISFAMGATKQLCNRLLEPFMWHTVLITASEWENFFELRCPIYESIKDQKFKSRKDAIKYYPDWNIGTDIDWLMSNSGQSEIHMMQLAECMYDAMNESVPNQLNPGEWHVPFNGLDANDEQVDKILESWINDKNSHFPTAWNFENLKIKIATARCARISYTVIGEESKEPNYANDIRLHDSLIQNGHLSPTEHCAQAQDDSEMYANFRGFKQYRKFLEENSSI
jgi:hypothetical protein